MSDRARLIALACKTVDSHAIAEEIVQESWLRWQGRGYSPTEARPLLFRIVANLAKDWRRSRTIEITVLSELHKSQSHAPSSETAVIARNELALVLRALRRLPARDFRAFRMRMLEGRPYKEIAARLGLSVSHTHSVVERVMVEIGLALDG